MTLDLRLSLDSDALRLHVLENFKGTNIVSNVALAPSLRSNWHQTLFMLQADSSEDHLYSSPGQ